MDKQAQSAISKNSIKYLGICHRPSERYAAEFRNPYTGEMCSLGTFKTAEEAAFAYDTVAIYFSGVEKAQTNFLYPRNGSASLPPPPSPSSSTGEAFDQNYGQSSWIEEHEHLDEESELIAIILQSFTHPEELKRMMTL